MGSLGKKFFEKAKAGDYGRNKAREAAKKKYGGQDQSAAAKKARRAARIKERAGK